MKQMLQKGFTLIELIVVLVIIGIVAAFAIPTYLDYIAKTQVSESIKLADSFKVKMAEWNANGFCRGTSADENIVLGKYAQVEMGGIYLAKDDETKRLQADPNETQLLEWNREPTGCYVELTFGAGTQGDNVSSRIVGKKLNIAFLNNGSLKKLSASKEAEIGVGKASDIEAKFVPSSVTAEDSDVVGAQ